MLLAVEGGGFFSSSASGYSKGLTLLLLGKKNEDRPMRVSPCNQYQLVDPESDPDIQLASAKNRLVRGCAPSVCFGRAATELDSPSPLKEGPNKKQEGLPQCLVSDKGDDRIHSGDLVDEDSSIPKIALRGSLKKPATSIHVSGRSGNEPDISCDNEDVPAHSERRKVQWTDTSGAELFEIREFEPSDDDELDDEFDNRTERTCSCSIM